MPEGPTHPVQGLGIAVLLGICVSCPSLAATLLLDPDVTTVEFSLGATLHTVRGTADLSRGEIQFDPDSGTVAGHIVIDATSASTGNESRDKKMHQKVLETGRFPEITFQPQRLEGSFQSQGESTLRLHGIMTIHGSSHTIVIDVRIDVTGDQLTGTARFTLPYVAWGMKDPSAFLLRVKKEVDITMVLGGTLRDQGPE